MIGENLMCEGYLPDAKEEQHSTRAESELHESEASEVSERQDEHGNWNWRRGSVRWKGSE
jgi:hypothetical protein